MRRLKKEWNRQYLFFLALLAVHLLKFVLPLASLKTAKVQALQAR
jgi:hypothetical protein